jgi:hypothetical protein
MLGAGVLFDLFVEFADVGGGNGGVATGFGLGFLVSASIRVVDKGGWTVLDTIQDLPLQPPQTILTVFQ